MTSEQSEQQSRAVPAQSGATRPGSVTALEINFDGLVGPTHNYAGLSHGNLASTNHASSISHPRQAALQGLVKMKFLHDLGVPQAVLPPQARPDLGVLRRLGFAGSDADVLQTAEREASRLLAAVYSSSAMWAANAATVSPSADTSDGRAHFTPANLVTQFHRSIEPPYTAAMLRKIFSGDPFAHHDMLPAADAFADEGAANHLRLCGEPGDAGLEVFVYGRDETTGPARYPARQTMAASTAIARRHGLDPSRTLVLRQSPAAIDAGVFHNDVVAASNQDVLLVHGSAFADTGAMDQIRHRFVSLFDRQPWIFVADPAELSLADAVATYLFNSQIVTIADGSMAMIAPMECRDHPGVQKYLDTVLASGCPLRAVHYVDLRQSMHNGGGPACLRLRVVLTAEQLAAVNPRVLFTDALHDRLVDLVNQKYREELHPADLADPLLAREAHDAIHAVHALLGMS